MVIEMELTMKGLNIIQDIERMLNNPIYNEQWRQVDGYANYYVSNCGRVKNITTEMILKQRLNRTGYYIIDLHKFGNKKTYETHRLVALAFIDNNENCLCVDHKNNDKRNNTVKNLRWCTTQQNNMNRSKTCGTSSKYKGVCYYKRNKRWQSQIGLNGKYIALGYYKTQEEAGEAYNKKATELFGEFAKLNKI